MGSHRFPELSRAELELMKILWAGGRLSAREVHEQIPAELGWAITTTRTVLDRLVAKGVLRRESIHKINVFIPVMTRPQGLARLVREFATRVAEVEPAAVVALFARQSRLSPAELEELAKLVREASEEGSEGHA
ncbi:MAG: BlaI/MecI/CopY family transcriptional regulator [Thermoanaerobaculaceae bacterium]|nr:BlaI/MecI/CopY family transcriptional regulator [Thermoanaerobaculaceae bacterium]MDI9621393.1 BlaI/MecI/CopY family transcriptional regulator [Acidobacteriota bacterium]NLH10998.1 BlaI/MecI/CopY family transcriptional regulator [Holophagae bacterium]HPW55434.1 BlaI/MecI/CopY family transcriptional regulator [Thermoanaerobaculaceae bacterium]